MLLVNVVVSIVEDDLFPLTLGCELQLNCIVLIKLACLVCDYYPMLLLF